MFIKQVIGMLVVVLLTIGAGEYNSWLCWILLYGFFWAAFLMLLAIPLYPPAALAYQNVVRKNKKNQSRKWFDFTPAIIYMVGFAYYNFWTLFVITIVLKALTHTITDKLNED